MSEIASPAAVLAQVEHCLQSQGRAVLCQIVRAEGSTPGKAGWKLLARPDGTFFGNLGGGAFEALVQADALGKLRPRADSPAGSELKRYYLTEKASRGEATGMVCGGMVEVFLEVLAAPPVLVVIGGGPVGQAVARAGELAGFELLVVDDRAPFRDPALFPAGARIEAVSRAYGEDFLAPVAHRDLYVAVLTRCWETDTAALAAVLRQAPAHLRYLGLMGSRRKVARVRAEVAAEGQDPGRLEREGLHLHAPIGLPIGGDTPGEIAISILAEVIRSRYGTAEEKPAVAGSDGIETVDEDAVEEMVADGSQS
jgi:xanthine dehydrogenase accessory factor